MLYTLKHIWVELLHFLSVILIQLLIRCIVSYFTYILRYSLSFERCTFSSSTLCFSLRKTYTKILNNKIKHPPSFRLFPLVHPPSLIFHNSVRSVFYCITVFIARLQSFFFFFLLKSLTSSPPHKTEVSAGVINWTWV